MENSVARLRAYLETQLPGPVDANEIKSLLASCWEDLDGSEATGMRGYKLQGQRMEDPRWMPPELSFRIVRHGAKVLGSSRGTVYRWIINTETVSASCTVIGRRQLDPLDKPLDVKPIAQSLADAITGRVDDDPRFERRADGTVKLIIAQIIPATNKQTTAKRRSRQRAVLRVALSDRGWKELRANLYAPAEGVTGSRRPVNLMEA